MRTLNIATLSRSCAYARWGGVGRLVILFQREKLMYAIVNADGHQRRVSTGDVIWIEKHDAGIGEKIMLDKVLLLNDGQSITVGAPMVEGAAVETQVLRQVRDRKVLIHKFKKRKGYARTKGHRQSYTEARVLNILLNGEPVKAQEPAASAAE